MGNWVIFPEFIEIVYMYVCMYVVLKKRFLRNVLPSFLKRYVCAYCKSKYSLHHISNLHFFIPSLVLRIFLNEACSGQIENLLSTNINGMTKRFPITESN